MSREKMTSMPAALSLGSIGARLRSLAPAGLFIESANGSPQPSPFHEEAAVISGWAEHRREQFILGRSCARRALASIGIAPHPILFDDNGAPTWPPGAVGSISHKRQNCIVAVGSAATFASVGVDLEIDIAESAEDEILRQVCVTTSEVAQAHAMRGPIASPGTLFLSAKEAFFKLQFPQTAEWLTFEDVEVVFHGGAFEVRRTDAPADTPWAGVFVVENGWIATLMTS